MSAFGEPKGRGEISVVLLYKPKHAVWLLKVCACITLINIKGKGISLLSKADRLVGWISEMVSRKPKFRQIHQYWALLRLLLELLSNYLRITLKYVK